MNIYTVYDSKVEAYMQPFFAPNNAVAIRLMINTVRTGESMLATNPADFDLFLIGEFNEHTGIIDSLLHVSLGKIISLINLKEWNDESKTKI